MSNGFAIDISSDLKLELSFAQALCELVDTPRALTVFLMIKNEEYSQLIDLECNPLNYQDHRNFADDYLVTGLLSKSKNLPLGIDRTQKALDVFWASEARCGETNDKLLSSPEWSFPDSVLRAKRLIRKVLGPLSKADLHFVERNFRFGPGATTGVRGSGSVLSDKYDEEIHLTSELIPFYRVIIGDRWWEYKTRPEVVKGNRFTTVPKNAKTDRGICVEPTLNIYGQLGVGALLRNRLLRLGINLSDQTRNQRLARDAYSLSLATIDLSAASDSLCWGAVMCLFPHDWFELLDLFRCSYTKVKGEYIELNKFSSMGNGYTFELESLLFAAVAFSCVPHDEHHLVSVYGDDIIVPQAYARLVIDALEFLGFSVNTRKSYLAGRFYESCGSDWFNGQPVRPFFLRKDPKLKTPYPVQIANALRLYASRISHDEFCDARFKDLWVQLYKLCPRTWKKCRVPASLGDTGIIVSEDENTSPKAEYGWQGWTVLHMWMEPVKCRKTTLGRLLAALACPVPDISTKGREPRRGYLREPVPRKTTIFEWSRGFTWA